MRKRQGELFADGSRVMLAPGHQGAVLDDEKILSESVVDLARQPFAFLFLGRNETLGEVALRLPFLFEPGHSPVVSRHHRCQDGQGGAKPHPSQTYRPG